MIFFQYPNVQHTKRKETTMSFRIKEIRDERKMTQEELAAKSGVSRTIISGLENGTLSTTTTQTLSKIAKALDTSVNLIFTD